MEKTYNETAEDKLTDERILEYYFENFDRLSIQEIAKTLNINENKLRRLIYSDLYGIEYLNLFPNTPTKEDKRVEIPDLSIPPLSLASPCVDTRPVTIKIKNNDGRYTEEFKRAVLDKLFQDGNIRRTAENCGVHPSTVYKWLRKYCPEKYDKYVNRKNQGVMYSKMSIDIIQSEIQSGKSYKEIANKYHLNAGSLTSTISLFNRLNKAKEIGALEERCKIQRNLKNLGLSDAALTSKIIQILFS